MKNNYLNIATIMGASIFAGMVNYAYYPLMLQYMSLEDFGLFGSIMGLLNMIGIISTGIVLFLNKEISKNIGDIGKVKNIFISSLKLLSLIGICGSILFMLISPLFTSYFQLDEGGYFILIGTTITISFCSTVVQSTLRGLKKFRFLSCIQVLGPVLKLLIGVLLVMYGYNIYGAIFGVILSGVLSLIISLIFIYKIFRPITKKGTTKELLSDFQNNKKDVSQFFLISLFFAFLMNIDVIVVQNIFEPQISGAYVGISVLGKFLIFLLLSIETVYYGQIMEYSKNSIPRHLIINPLVIMSITVLGAIIFNIFFGKWILHFLKPELIDYYSIYLLSLIYYALLAYISFFAKILVGWENKLANRVLFSGSILLIVIIYTCVTNLQNFMYAFISIGVIATGLLGLIFIKEISQSQILDSK